MAKPTITNDPAQMAINRANLVAGSGGTLVDNGQGNVVPASYSRLPATPPPTTTVTPPANPVITPTAEVTKEAPFDETKARNDAIASRESQFSAISRLYEDRIKSMTDAETEVGKKDLARVNTISAMTGMAGGGDAISRAGASDKTTKDIIKNKTDAINYEKMMAISGIYDKIDQNVINEKNLYATKSRADQTLLTDKMNNAAMSNVNAFATQGISWEKAMKDPDFQSEVKRTGKTAFEVQKLYNDSLPNNLKPKELFSGFKGDNYVQLIQNADGTVTTSTHTAKELGIPTTVEDVGTVTVDNKVFWYDKKNPVNADGTPKLIQIGNKTTPKTPTANYISLTPNQKRNILSTGLTADAIKNIEADLQKADLNTVLEGITDIRQKEAVRAAFEKKGGGA